MHGPEHARHESLKSIEVRAAVEALKLQIGEAATNNERLLPETKMRILEALRVQPVTVTQEIVDSSKSYEKLTTEEQVRSYFGTRIGEKVGPFVLANKNDDEKEAFHTFLLRRVAGIKV